MKLYQNIIIIVASFTLNISVFAQQKQENYNSLLWEISGNGLTEKSYLYGTMHVSSKIAFQLSDPFFKALENADMIALESNPENWIENFSDLGLLNQMSRLMPRGSSGENYYSPLFSYTELDRKSLLFLFNYRNQMIDQILYRFQPGMEDYSEKTYLDMFIFQSAKKNKKPVYALENFKESYLLSLKGQIPDENGSGNRRYVNGSDMQEMYVSRDLNKLDSLIRNGFSDNYQKYMLHERNENMVTALDSLMPKGSVFSGVGAAHLPGQKGMINLLREAGYTVKSIQYYATDKGRKKFSDWQDKVLEQDMQKVTASDNKYELECIDKFHKSTQSYLFSRAGIWLNDQYVTDYANGGFYTVSRLATFPFMSQEIDFTNIQFLDSLLYLVVPGDIKKKKEINEAGYPGFEVQTELSNNQHMLLKVFVTPVELIVFKVGGSKNYIKGKNAKKFYKSISLNEQSKNPAVDIDGLDFTVNLPGKKFIMPYDTNKNFDFSGYSYDPESEAYYVVKSELKYNDDYIEEDDFELRYLVKQITREMKVDTFSIHYPEPATATFSFDHKTQTFHGKILKKGLRYYLLMTNAGQQNDQDTFLNSFRFKAPQLDYTYEEETDSSMLFKSKLPESELDKETFEMLEKGLEDLKRTYKERYKNDDAFLGGKEEQIILNPYTGEKISLYIYTTHKYNWETGKNIYKSLQERGENMFGDRLNKDSSNLILHFNITDSTINDSIKNYQFMVSRKGSQNIIEGNIWRYRNAYYEATIIRNQNDPSAFYNTFVSNFSPIDSSYYGISKTGLDTALICDLTAADSLKVAQASRILYDYTPYDTNYVVAELQNILANHSFEFENADKKVKIMSRLSDLMEKEAFIELMVTTIDQAKNPKVKEEAIVNLTYQYPTEKGYKAFANYIEKDPLTVLLIEDSWNFYLDDSLALTALLVPELLQINKDFPDTKENYIWEYSTCLDSGFIQPELFSEYKQSILIKAMQNTRKILLKERNNKEEMTDEEWQFSIKKEFDYYSLDDEIKALLSEIHFLFHFRDDPKVAQLMEKIAEIENETIQFYLFRFFASNDAAPINQQKINDIISTPAGKYRFVRYLSAKKNTQKFLDTLVISTRDYLDAYAADNESRFYYKKEGKHDSIAFLKKIVVQNYIDTSSTYIYEKWEDGELDQYIVFKNVPDKIEDFDEINKDTESFYSYNSDKESKSMALKKIEDRVLYSDRLRLYRSRYDYPLR